MKKLNKHRERGFWNWEGIFLGLSSLLSAGRSSLQEPGAARALWSCMVPLRWKQDKAGTHRVGNSFIGLHGLAANAWAFMFRHATVSL